MTLMSRIIISISILVSLFFVSSCRSEANEKQPITYQISDSNGNYVGIAMLVTINGMPCIYSDGHYDSGLSCDWSKWQKE
jgi:hypothetical protein